jgi:exo-1,4-beta-D-glucosaminidase
VLVENLYWQSTVNDVLEHYTQSYSVFSQHGDYSALNQLPMVDLDISSESKTENGEETAKIILTNNTNALAFFTQVEITKDADGEEVLPVVYNDNYVTLFPSETIHIVAKYKTASLQGAQAHIRIDGSNVSKAVVALQ